MDHLQEFVFWLPTCTIGKKNDFSQLIHTYQHAYHYKASLTPLSPPLDPPMMEMCLIENYDMLSFSQPVGKYQYYEHLTYQ